MKNFLFTFVLFLVTGTSHAAYEVRLKDGATLTWDSVTADGGQYCTQKPFGKFCIQKDDVSSIRETSAGATDANPANKIAEPVGSGRSLDKTDVGPHGSGRTASGAIQQRRKRTASSTELRFLSPSAPSGKIHWRYTFETPSRDWISPRFIDTGWKDGVAGFGADTPGAPINTLWRTADIWMRREFTLSSAPTGRLALWVQHDDDVEVYLNGFLAASTDGWTAYYDFISISAEARPRLRLGSNVIAVHCRNRGGPQYIDAGIVEFPWADLPLSGYETSPRLAVFTDAVKEFMEEHLIPAGTIAVMKKDRIVVSRGIGYADREQTTPLRPDAMMRLASLDKLVTNAAMKELIRRSPKLPVGGTLTLDTLVFPLLEAYGVRAAPSKAADPRLREITIRQILDHRSGLAHFPAHGSLDLERDLGLIGPAGPRDKTRWLMTQPLRFAPGTQFEYNSSAYAVARYLIHLVTGDLAAFLKEAVLKPALTTDMDIARSLPWDRDPREPWYSSRSLLRNVLQPQKEEFVAEPDGAINLEAALAFTSSAEAYVRFMRRYHVGHGTRLEDPLTGRWAAVPDNGLGVYFGSMAGTFTIAIQRRWDEVNIAVLLNQSGKYDGLAEELNKLVDTIPPDSWE